MYSRILKLPPRSRTGNFSKSSSHFSECDVIRGGGGGGVLANPDITYRGIKHETCQNCTKKLEVHVASSSSSPRAVSLSLSLFRHCHHFPFTALNFPQIFLLHPVFSPRPVTITAFPSPSIFLFPNRLRLSIAFLSTALPSILLRISDGPNPSFSLQLPPKL